MATRPRRPASIERRLQEIADAFAPEIRAAFLGAIQDIVDRAILKDIIDAIEIGDVNAAFKATGLSDAALRPVTAMLERAFETGGVMVAGSFPKRLATPSGNAIFRFDVRNSRAEAWLRDEGGKLITNIRNDAMSAVQNALQDGMVHGLNSKNVALDIVGRIDPTTQRRSGGLVGLTNQQQNYVINARHDLQGLDARYFTRERRDKRFDTVVRKAIVTNTPLPADTITKITNRYSDNLLKLRGETIGRTEANTALNQSQYEAMKQAADIGAIDKSATQKIWDSSGDARTRKDHLKMEGQTVGFDEPFTAPDGSRLMYPHDTSLGAPARQVINCRCRVKWAIDWFAGVT